MGSTITLRATTSDDLSAVDALLARSYPRLLSADYPPSVMVLAVPLLARAQPRLIASGTYYLAEDREGRVLGVGGWTRRRDGAAEIRHVATDPGALRLGIGRAILGFAFDAARDAGCRGIRCLSTRTAVPFYRALGLTEVGPVTIPLAAGIDFPAVEMTGTL